MFVSMPMPMPKPIAVSRRLPSLRGPRDGLTALAVLASVAVLGATPASAAPPTIGLLATIPSPGNPVAIAVDPSLDTVYVASFGGSISVLDGATGQPKHAPIPIDQATLSIAVDPTTHKVYVPNGQTAAGSVLSIIDGANLSAPVVNAPIGCCANGVAVNPATHTVYVTNTPSPQGAAVSVLDGTTGQPIHNPIPVGVQPNAVAVDPSTNKVYVAEATLAELWVIDGATNTLDPTPIEGSGVTGQLAIDPSTHTVYVASGPENAVTAISEATNHKVATISLGAANGNNGVGASGIAVDPSTHAVYVGDSLSKAVSVIDGSDPAAAPSILSLHLPVNLQQDIFPIAVDPSTHFAYAADFTGDTLSVVVPFATTVPGAPTAVTASVHGAATVAFKAPASDGGSPIVSYTVTVKDLSFPADGGQTVTESASEVAAAGGTITVSPINLNQRYQFTVAATNAVGTGAAQASNVVISVGKVVGGGGCGPGKCQ